MKQPNNDETVKTKLEIYDIVCSDVAARIVHGVFIDQEHECHQHRSRIKMVVYKLSSTTNHNWVNTEWCYLNLLKNGYNLKTKMDNKDRIKYKPFEAKNRPIEQ